jgi:hypothetical protein
MWQYVIPAISAIVVAALTSGGLWALVAKRADKNDAERKMLVGLAHAMTGSCIWVWCMCSGGTLRRMSTKT